jgi:hypothetical protein
MCEQLHTPCVVDLTLDMRRRTALQRTVEESKAFQATLNGIISVLREGDGSLIHGLVSHIQQNDDKEDLIETLQTRFRETRERDTRSPERRIKHEMQDGFEFESDDEQTQSPEGSFAVPGLSRKRPLSSSEIDGSRPSRNPSQYGSSGDQEVESLASRYLPLLLKLKAASDLEATRMLHDFRTSPIDVDGVASLNLFDRHQPRPSLNINTSRLARPATGDESNSPDRDDWHPSLQLTTPDQQTQITGNTFSRNRSEDWNITEGVCFALPHN